MSGRALKSRVARTLWHTRELFCRLKLRPDSSILRGPWQSQPTLNWAITIPKIDRAVNRYLTSGVCQRKSKHVSRAKHKPDGEIHVHGPYVSTRTHVRMHAHSFHSTNTNLTRGTPRFTTRIYSAPAKRLPRPHRRRSRGPTFRVQVHARVYGVRRTT